jgi:hypothetical protein
VVTKSGEVVGEGPATTLRARRDRAHGATNSGCSAASPRTGQVESHYNAMRGSLQPDVTVRLLSNLIADVVGHREPSGAERRALQLLQHIDVEDGRAGHTETSFKVSSSARHI